MIDTLLLPGFDPNAPIDAPMPLPAPEIGHTDPRLPEVARKRLGGQNGRVLARLRQGPATNLELETASGSHRINSRVADVRRYLRAEFGQTVLSCAIDTAAGLYRYQIGVDR